MMQVQLLQVAQQLILIVKVHPIDLLDFGWVVDGRLHDILTQQLVLLSCFALMHAHVAVSHLLTNIVETTRYRVDL